MYLGERLVPLGEEVAVHGTRQAAQGFSRGDAGEYAASEDIGWLRPYLRPAAHLLI